jgi:glycosyltransferase involved in cell wall biosynthesis
MTILWICPFPGSLAQNRVENNLLKFFKHPAPWITAHLPPPEFIDLHVASMYPGGKKRVDFEYLNAKWHLIPVPATGRSTKFFVGDHRYFESLFNELSPDVVHAWGTEDSNALIAQKILPKRTLIGIQGLICKYLWVSGPNGFFRRLICLITENIALTRARFLVAESSYSLECAAKLAPKAKGYVVQHPIQQEFLKAEILEMNDPVALFVGDLCPRKGIIEAIIAFASAAPMDWVMRIAGDGDPIFVNKLKKISEKLNLSHRISFLGKINTLALTNEMMSASVFLLPTKTDTGPTSLKEAICMGLWPVCYDNSGPGEYIRKFKWGSLADNLNQQDLTRKLKAAIHEKPWLNNELRKSVVFQSRSFFSSQTCWDELIAIYKKIQKSR